MPTTEDTPARRPRQGPKGPFVGVACLLLAACGLAMCAVFFGPDRPGWRGAVAFAACVSLPGALTAWVLTHVPNQGAALNVATPLAAMALRIMPPLAALAWLSGRPKPSVDPSAASTLVVFYLGLLAVDISLHIMEMRAGTRNQKVPD